MDYKKRNRNRNKEKQKGYAKKSYLKKKKESKEMYNGYVNNKKCIKCDNIIGEIKRGEYCFTKFERTKENRKKYFFNKIKTCPSCENKKPKCKECGIKKSIENFSFFRVNMRRKYCKDCERIKNTVRRKIFRQRQNKQCKEIIINYLLNNPCVDCGEQNILLLEFDHIKGDKKFSIMQYESYTVNNLKDELSKCCCRCTKCHRLKTARDFNYYKGKKIRPLKRKYNEYKDSIKCKKCGENRKELLDFNHINKNEKSGTISNMVNFAKYSWDIILEEIKKCEVLCCSCHRLETTIESNKSFKIKFIKSNKKYKSWMSKNYNKTKKK